MSALALAMMAMMLTGAATVAGDDAQPRSPLQRPLRGEEPDLPGFLLTLGPHGRIANCIVTRPRGAFDLGPDPCQILRERARYEARRFRPARDPATAFLCDADTGEFAWRRQRIDDQPVPDICRGRPEARGE